MHLLFPNLRGWMISSEDIWDLFCWPGVWIWALILKTLKWVEMKGSETCSLRSNSHFFSWPGVSSWHWASCCEVQTPPWPDSGLYSLTACTYVCICLEPLDCVILQDAKLELSETHCVKNISQEKQFNGTGLIFLRFHGKGYSTKQNLCPPWKQQAPNHYL